MSLLKNLENAVLKKVVNRKETLAKSLNLCADAFEYYRATQRPNDFLIERNKEAKIQFNKDRYEKIQNGIAFLRNCAENPDILDTFGMEPIYELQKLTLDSELMGVNHLLHDIENYYQKRPITMSEFVGDMHRVKKEIIEKQKEVGVLAEKKEAEPVMRIVKIEKEVPNVKPKNKQKTTISVVKSENIKKADVLKGRIENLKIKIRELINAIKDIDARLNYYKLKVEERLKLNNLKSRKEQELRETRQELKTTDQDLRDVLKQMPRSNKTLLVHLFSRQRAA